MASDELSCRTTNSLLNLPVEIRTEIFKWVFASPGEVMLKSPYVPYYQRIREGEWNEATGHSMKLSSSCPRSAQLLRVSRQICQEGSLVLYGCNLFVLTGLCLEGDDPSSFLISNFGIKNVGLIRHIAMGRPPHARNLRSFGALRTLELRLHRSPDSLSQSEVAALSPQNVEAWIMEKQLFSMRIDEIIRTKRSLTVSLRIAVERRHLFCACRGCNSPWFASRYDLSQHRRNAQGLHGYAGRSYVCSFSACDHSREENGFLCRWNFIAHMRRVHGFQISEIRV
jgi:hypothetical protein